MLSDDFKILNTLGSGSFGTVYKVLRYEDKKDYVVKAIRIKDLSSREQLSAVNEVKLLAKIKNPYIVKYYDYYLDKEYLHIVMEYCNYGDLTRLIKKAKSKQTSEDTSTPGNNDNSRGVSRSNRN
jgi:serine/threonine protein kinase